MSSGRSSGSIVVPSPIADGRHHSRSMLQINLIRSVPDRQLTAKCFQQGGRTDVGGMGSGRTPRRGTDESTGSFVLGVKGPPGPPPRGARGPGPLTSRSGRWGELPVEVRLDTTDPAAPHLELTHETRGEPAERVAYQVRLVTTRPRYGGERWWF